MPRPRLAASLLTLRNQIDERWPLRSKASDGWIGDARHAARKSDHNPNAAGVVCALDITHDPAHGLDATWLAERLRLARDPRLAYVISAGRIANPAIADGAWRPYKGANPHTRHVHVSVRQDAALYDDGRPWALDDPIPAPVPVPRPPLLRMGSKGPDVARLQALLRRHGVPVAADGYFGAGTEKALKNFQAARGLRADGVAGAKTWAVLEERSAPEPARDFVPARAAGADFDRLVRHYEGLAKTVYRIGGILHAGWGHRLRDDEGLREGDPVPDDLIERWWREDKTRAEALVLKHVRVPLAQHQFDAVASIVWNGGDYDDPHDRQDAPLFWRTPSGVLAEALNAGDMQRAAAIIAALGNKPARDGKIYLGIARRRHAEAALFRGEEYRLS